MEEAPEAIPLNKEGRTRTWAISRAREDSRVKEDKEEASKEDKEAIKDKDKAVATCKQEWEVKAVV